MTQGLSHSARLASLGPAILGACLVAGCGAEVPVPPITNEAPIAHLRAPVIAPAGRPVTLDASQSSDVDGNPLDYRFDLMGFVGTEPATDTSITSVTPVVAVTFPAAGFYSVHLTVTDLYGVSADALQDVSVRDDYPEPPDFCATAQDCVVGDECTDGVCFANGGGLGE